MSDNEDRTEMPHQERGEGDEVAVSEETKGRGDEAAPGAEAKPTGATPQRSGASGRSGRRPARKLEIVDTTGEPPARAVTTGHTVLLVESDPELRAKVRDSLPQGYELVTARAGEAGLRAARLCGPDLILFDPATGGEDTLSRLHDDPLTSSIPIIPLLGEASSRPAADHISLLDPVTRPLNVVELRGRISAAVEGQGTASGLRMLQGDLGEASLAEVVDFVQREINRWVLEAAGPERGSEKIRLGQSGRLMGALWAFVARLREVVVRGSGGRIEFQAHREEGRISMLTLSTGEAEQIRESDVIGASITAEGIERLRGLRAVVADDDQAVRWAFGAVLGEVGLKVEAVTDGVEALEAIARERPDLVITDILMPRLDGWELLRRLRRDLLLRDVPVIVLSWKEDFLQRMRELEADADEYMRKEVDRDQILLRLSSVLSARQKLEDRLATKTEDMAGRVEATGIVPLLRAVAERVGHGRLTVRETWNQFEADFREGRLVRATNVTTGGFETEGLRALGLLLGVSRGRYVVARESPAEEPNLEGELEAVLSRAAGPLQEMIELVAGGGIVRVAQLRLGPEPLEQYLQLAPQEVGQVVRRLEAGESPRELILAGVCSPQELERIALDLIRRGAVEQVIAPPPASSAPPAAPGDEDRWAAVGGDVPAPGRPPSSPAERASIPSDISPQPSPLGSQEARSRRNARIRTWAYLLIVALAAFIIGHCLGQEAEAAEVPPPESGAGSGGVGNGEGRVPGPRIFDSLQ